MAEYKISSQLEKFLNEFELVKYKKGQILFRPGEKLTTAYIEKTGFLRAYTVNGKNEATLPILKPLFLCLGISGLYERVNKYFVETITEVELWAVPMEEFLNFANKNKSILAEINQKVVGDLLDLSDHWQLLTAGDSESKVAGLIHMIAKDFGKKDADKVLINFNVPHRVLASMAGLTRETVTLQILKFQKKGYLYNKKRTMVIKKIEKIREVAKV